MSQAGPSRPRQTQRGRQSPVYQHDSPAAQKRRKITDAKQIFEKPDMEEQVRLGREYRSLQADADEMRANMENITAEELARALDKQDNLFANVRDTGIGTLDANLFKTNAENAMALAKKFKIDGVAFDIDEFLIRVQNQLGLDRAELGDQDEASDEDSEDGNERPTRQGALGDWEKLGWMAAKMCRRIPGVNFMYGPLSVQPNKQVRAARKQREPLAAEIRPTEVQTQEGDKKSKDDFASHVIMVYKVLGRVDPGREGYNLFRLVVHPEDYGQTVENCFFVSFLLNQGRAGISVKDNGEVLIRQTEEHDADIDGEAVKNQAVVELDMDTWKNAIKTFNITKPQIPNRDYAAIRKQMAGNAWYS
ncbi:hypothetical protein IAU60_005377 [Kwoniella sp. DSM 27419]